MLRLLTEQGAPDRTVLHCFSGDAEVAREAVRRGYYLSYAGTVTFRSAGMLREALTLTPLDQLLVETDAPYLAPVPFRGRRNESAYIPHIAAKLAEATGRSVEEIARITTTNAQELFRR